jgi:DNA-directed RNA polymerase specialized sigma24 family protein
MPESCGDQVTGRTEESVSLTEALRAGAPDVFGVLYDEHAERLYAYCHIMVGEEAADAVRDAFIAVARHPGTAPDDDALPVWLYALARAECVRRGALVRKPAMPPSADPLRRALARLRPEHREVLALSTALETDEIARVIGVAADTAEMLVRVSQRRLEQAAASVLGVLPVNDEPMLTALSSGNLHELVMRGYEAPPRQRERVLFSCAAAERAADGALLFDQDGMPIPLDGLFGTAEDPTHPFAKVGIADEPTGPMHRLGTEAPAPAAGPSLFEPRHVSRGGNVHGGHARPKKEPFLSRKRDGLVEVAGLAACVAAATSVLALWPSSHNDGASNMDGTSLFLHRGASASRSAEPAPPVNAGPPPQGATSKPGASPTPTPTESQAATDPAAPTPPETTTPDQPAPPPADGPGSAHPTPPPHDDPPPSDPPPSDPPPSDPPTTTPTPTPTPSDSPTDAGGDSPAPDPSTP